VEVHLF